ncbi:protein containing DUF29 [Candidatus Omnitrophus magneticus]|uniref:Protein containing DUF29 n=1 Tax=Candidatus Omnitrophus magneticus TaxID=1609969 RepID=A0A0F0CR97_9BACT|nr:protein containing DUF29 [Candidatus Omnitrophus magneticus]
MEILEIKDKLTTQPVGLSPSSLYETDFYQWTLHNAELLRQGRFSEIDTENMAEEIENLGGNNKRELLHRLVILIMHLLKWQYQPERRSRSWKSTVVAQRENIDSLLEQSPSLRYGIETVIAKALVKAGKQFEAETGISRKVLPGACPYTFEQIMDDEFWPD